MANSVLQSLLYLFLLVVLAWPLGGYMGKVMNGEPCLLSRVFSPVEKLFYRCLGIDAGETMDWRQYLTCVLAFSGVSVVALMLLLLCQQVLPLNPENRPGLSWPLAFNTAVSFVTNTNWQAYSGERTMGQLAQMAGLCVQNFLSPGVGMAVLFALLRGLAGSGTADVGNFWVDLTRAVIHVLLPLSLVVSLALIWQGVPQNFSDSGRAALLEPQQSATGLMVTEQFVPLGPQASQVAPKQLGTNGGGYNGANSAHPLENPTPLSNLIELLSLLLVPAGLCFSFGRAVHDHRQGVAVFLAMFLLLGASLAGILYEETAATPQLAQAGMTNLRAVEGPLAQAGGNMEGKETRFGIASSATWAAFTTASSNGSVNSMHDSYTPLGGLVTMLLMQLGEVVFGGAGSGLYGMLAFVVLTVFMAGLMVGRTPEYLGKKIEPFDMKMAVTICLAGPVLILISSALCCLWPGAASSMHNPLPHGFSEILYACSSAGGNNGSAFAGFDANTPFLNLLLGLVMCAARFVPIAAALALAGSLAGKRHVAASSGTLSTCNPLFVFLLMVVVILVGALSFFPALALGPLAEYCQMAHPGF